MGSNRVVEAVQQFITRLENKPSRYWVAYSGGVDSHVLLHALHNLGEPVTAIHVHHGLNALANAWQQHCQSVCAAMQLPFYMTQLHIQCGPKDSWEAEARKARYAYFASMVPQGDLLLTGHHQEDQAETVLLQLLRGAGPKGLSAMPAHKGPLLTVSRQEILVYAKQHQLVWVEDESNLNERYARNYLRQRVMPLLKQRWPSMAATLSRSARLCAESEGLLAEYAQQLLAACQVTEGLSIPALKQLSVAQQKLVLRHYLQRRAFPLPSEIKLETILNNVVYARLDRKPVVQWADRVATRRKTVLAIGKTSEIL